MLDLPPPIREHLSLVVPTLAIFFSLAFAWSVLVDRDPHHRRIDQLRRRRQNLRREIARGKKRSRREMSDDLMRRVVNGLKVAQYEQVSKIRQKLLRAGKRPQQAAVPYMFMKIFLPVLVPAVTFLLLSLVDFGATVEKLELLIISMAAALGFLAPDIYLKNAAQKRGEALQRALPDGLDLLVICAEAGLSLDHALNRVGEEIIGAHPVLAEEFSLTAIELSLLPERRDALKNLAERSGLGSMRGVVNTLLQTEKYGTPLSQSLRILSADFREQRMLKAEEKAARLPAIMTVPMIVFILPALFIVLAGPAMLDVYENLMR